MGTQETMLLSGSSSAAAVYPQRWMLLAPHGECEADEGSSCFTAVSTTVVAAAHTSGGHLISVSLRLAPPPAMSRVHVRYPEDVCWRTYATVMAAHGDSVLIHIVSYLWWYRNCEDRYTRDYFVYHAGGGANPTTPPSLYLLRSPYASTGQRRLNMSATGLLRRGEAAGEFVVAELKMVEVKVEVEDDSTSTAPTKKVAELIVFRSGEWCVKRPRIRGKDGEVMLLPSSWEAEATVVGFAPGSTRTQNKIGEEQIEKHEKLATQLAGLLCWVDFAHGVIFSDVFDESPVLRYTPFPVDAAAPFRSWYHGGFIGGSCLCITARGTVNLVDVSPRRCSDIGCSTDHDHGIHAWTLKTRDMAWVMESMVDVDSTELWALDNYLGGARVQLVYPVVSVDDDGGHVIPDESGTPAAEEGDDHEEGKQKKQQVDDESARPRRSKRATTRNVRVTDPEWAN
ncbi:hypothetical protein ACP70R_022544 [Stipagrostis hirtigluma subsp. patula]